MSKQRYKTLVELIAQAKPTTIVETGTWNGDRAIEMATEALKHSETVRYLGFDLFEDATDETDAREFNVKPHVPIEQVQKKLETFKAENPGFDYTLVKGDTNQTLRPTAVDFAFIDGGHSIETVRNDLEKLRGSRIVVLDDYYEKDADGKIPDISKVGCNKLLEDEDHVVIGPADPVRDGGVVRLAVLGIEAGGGGGVDLKVKTHNCVQDDIILENIRHALSFGVPFVPQCRPHGRHVTVVGSGPSARENLDLIREAEMVVCVKSAHRLLIDNGIVPWGCVLLDPRPDVLKWVDPPHPEVRYLVASMVHTTVWDHLMAHNVPVWGWHALVGSGEAEVIKQAHMREIRDSYDALCEAVLNKGAKLNDLRAKAAEREEVMKGRYGRGGLLVQGGTTALLRGIGLLESMGFRNFTLVGADSCYFEKPDIKERDKLGRPRFLEVVVGGETFWTDLQLLAQCQDFEKLMKLGNLNLNIVGEGLLAKVQSMLDAEKSVFEEVFGTSGNL